MTGEFVSPNWHVVLIHYPIALLTAGIIIEILSFMWPRGGFRAAGRWMLALGALLTLPTITLGIYALRDVMAPGQLDPDAKWHQLADANHWAPQQWQYMRNHIWLNSIAAGLAIVATVIWVANSDHWRRRLYWPILVVFVAAVVIISSGAWNGGEAVYEYGTAVNPAILARPAGSEAGAASASGTGRYSEAGGGIFTDEPQSAPALPATSPAARPPGPGEAGPADHAPQSPEQPSGVQRYVPPLQLHLLLVGFAAAFACGGLAVMIMRWEGPAAAVVPTPGAVPVTPLTVEPGEAGVGPQGVPPPGLEQPLRPLLPRVYPGRFFLATFLIALGAAIAGLWSVLPEINVAALRDNYELLRSSDSRRLLVHVIFGVGIVVLAVILALIVRYARRLRSLPVLLSILLFLAVAGQFWLGILMLYDSMHGPLTGFSPRPPITAVGPG